MEHAENGNVEAVTELTAWCRRYLQAWHEQAVVRTLPHYEIPSDAEFGVLFPEDMMPWLDNPIVVAKGGDARRFLSIQMAYRFVEDIAILETDAVGRLCSAFAHDHLQVAYPSEVRQVALTVATDEAYHALAARSFAQQLAEATGVASCLSVDRHAYVDGVRWVHDNFPAETAKEFLVIALCMAENSITEEGLGLTRATSSNNPFHHYNREHMRDEARHRKFFRRLMAYHWSALGDDVKAALAPIFAEYLDVVLMDMTDVQSHMRRAFEEIGLTLDEIGSLDDVFRTDDWARDRHPIWWNIHAVLEMTGVLDHAPTRQALEAGGWRAPGPVPTT